MLLPCSQFVLTPQVAIFVFTVYKLVITSNTICFLPNISFYLGKVKEYLRNDTLNENMPKVLASVKIATIGRWEHRMVRWIDAYQGPKLNLERSLKGFGRTDTLIL
jgi:hypothetical protein